MEVEVGMEAEEEEGIEGEEEEEADLVEVVEEEAVGKELTILFLSLF